MNRISFDEYFMEFAKITKQRATCTRLAVGCVLVKEKQIISTGYNGSVSGTKHCIDEGCMVRDNHCIRTIHAEQNAVIQAGKRGISTEGATAYVTHFPCLHCTKTLIQAGINEVVYLEDYKNDVYALALFNAVGVLVRKF